MAAKEDLKEAIRHIMSDADFLIYGVMNVGVRTGRITRGALKQLTKARNEMSKAVTAIRRASKGVW